MTRRKKNTPQDRQPAAGAVARVLELTALGLYLLDKHYRDGLVWLSPGACEKLGVTWLSQGVSEMTYGQGAPTRPFMAVGFREGAAEPYGVRPVVACWRIQELLAPEIERILTLCRARPERWRCVCLPLSIDGPKCVSDCRGALAIIQEDAVRVHAELRAGCFDASGRKEPAHHTAAGGQVPWDESLDVYRPLTEAVNLCKGLWTLSTLSKNVRKPQSSMRYMQRGQRCKVHLGDLLRELDRTPGKRQLLGAITEEASRMFGQLREEEAKKREGK